MQQIKKNQQKYQTATKQGREIFLSRFIFFPPAHSGVLTPPLPLPPLTAITVYRYAMTYYFKFSFDVSLAVSFFDAFVLNQIPIRTTKWLLSECAFGYGGWM